MARTKNSGSDVLSIKSAKHKSVSGDASNANDVKSVKSVKKNAKTAKRSSSSTATSVSGRRLGVAAVALASTLSMVLPGAAALARTSFNPDSFDPSYVNSVAKTSGKGAGNGAGKGSGNGKGDGDGNGLYKNGLLNTGATSDRTMRQMVDSVKEYLVKNTDSNAIAEGVKNQETVAGDSSVGVKDSGEYFVTNGDSSSPSNRSFDTNNFEDRSATSSADNSATKTATKSEQDTASSEIAKPVKSAKKPDVKHTKAEQTNPAETGKVAEKPKSNASVPATKTTEKPAVAKPKVENSVKPADTKASDTKPAATNPDAVKPAGTKPAAAPASKQPTQPETSQPASAKPVAKTEPEAKAEPNQNSAQTEHAENQQPANAKPAASNTDSEGTKPTDVKPAENQQPANAQSGNAESSKPAAEQNTNAQPSSTHSENTNTVSDANTPNGRVRRSVGSGDGASNGGSVAPADNTTATPTTTPASNTTAPSAPVTPASAESNAGAGTTANPSSEKPSAQTNAQGSQSSAEGATTGATSEDKSATHSATAQNTASEPGSASSNNPTSSPASTSTPTTGTPTTGTTTNNAATDPNSQVIKPNTDNPTAGSTSEANGQVQTDKKPKATYNLKIRYTIGGAANKQLVQPYELTIDVEKLNKLDDVNSYEYIELPKSAGYRPSVYHSGDYQYYVKKGEGDNSKFVIDDGTDADAVRYLRLSKKLITDYAVKERPAVGGNNGAQAPQTSSSQATTNPQSSSSTQPKAEDGIQYYGELNINYAPKTAKYYVRHLVQDLDHKDEFHDAPNLGIGKVITVKHKDGTSENIHVTEITGTVGSDVTAVSTYIPGYEPEHNLISSPLSDSEDESDKLVLNLRYYRKAYEVTYDSAGGTDVTAQKVYYQQPVPKVTKPTRRGYTFKGWSLVDPSKKSNSLYDDNTIVSLDDYQMPDHNVQFLANWEANKTTSYRVNVWVQKADLVDKEHPNSLANYDFVGLVERKNVQTDSEVALDKMDDAGVAKDTSKLNGESVDDYVESPELGLTRKELQGTEANDHEDGLIAKFNWMNDTHVTNLDGYDTNNLENNYIKDSKGNYVKDAKGIRTSKDLFTRYFHVNKELTKKLNREEHDFVPGRPDFGKRSKSMLCADDLNNTLNLVYDRNTYELIFAKPAKSFEGANNAAIKKTDEHGKTTIYCYAGGGECSKKYDGATKDEHGTEINHKGYRVNVRYGQKLTDIWPGAEEIDLSNDLLSDKEEKKASLGWRIGPAGKADYRDTPPFRFTKKEFADPKFRVVGEKQAPKISDDPEHNPQTTHELKDNQRLLTVDTTGAHNDIPYTVIIKKQSIASAKSGNDPSDDDYVISTDSYAKDDTNNDEYKYTAPSIAGFEPKDEKVKPERDDFSDFYDKIHDIYNNLTGEDTPDEDAPEEDRNSFPTPNYTSGEEDEDGGLALKNLNDAIAERLKTDPAYKKYYEFKKKYHISWHSYLVGFEGKLKFGDSNVPNELEENGIVTLEYKRQKYFVRFYNADGNAIKDGSVAATEELPFEYSLSKRGNAKLTGKDADLYYDNGNVKSYDASVTKNGGTDTATQFDGKYTFTLNGKTYSIERPKNLPKDYVFKGWAVDQAGTRFINGEDKDITVPVNGIKLYAAWGKPEGIKHTVTLNYNMPEIDGNGKEIKDSNVVTKQQFDHYYVIKENKDIKVPTRKGYDFYGWEIKKNGTTLPYAFGNKVVEDITLDAVWVKDTRYNGTFKHIFLKPGYTFTDYKNATNAVAKAAMVDHVSTQTVSGLREHLRYNAEAVYSDETHFPDKHFTSFEASSDENQNTGEFVYQTYNTRKYKVRYVTIGEDGKEKDLLPESEVSSINRKYDVAFYKPIEGFMPETTQNSFTYDTYDDGKQKADTIPEITFRYKDVRVLKRKCYPPQDTEHPQDTEYQDPKHPQYRPDHYTRYVFKVAKDQSSMGSVVDWQGSKVADGSALVYDAIKGTKAYQMPLPTVKAKQGYEFAGWTSKIGSSEAGSTELQYSDGVNRLPIRSEEQNSPEVIYIANFKLKAPVAAAPQVLTPKENISTGSSDDAKKLITNANDYPADATFSFAPGEKFDNTPGLHKIKVQVTLGNNTAAAEVLYRVLPDLVYASDWDKFKATDYGSNNAGDYVPITFTGKNDEGTIIGHDGGNANTPAGGETTLTAYVYKGKDVRIRVPQAFGKDYNDQHYHYVFKGWATKVVEPTTSTPSSGTTSAGTAQPEQKKPEQTFDINSSDRYKKVNLDNGVTYHAIYKRIDYFSSSSDNGTVPEDSVVAIFKPAPGRKWKIDGTNGPKVFYVKKGTDLSQITKTVDGKTVNVLEMLQNNLTNPTGKWSRSSMLNDGNKVAEVKDVADVTGDWKDGWHVNEPFQEFVADQTPWTEPEVQTDYLVAVQDKRDTLPALDKYLTNLDDLKKEAETKGDIEDVKIEYDLPKGKDPKDFEDKMLKKPSLYTVPLRITVNYKDGVEPKKYKRVARLKVIYQLMYPESLPKVDNTHSGTQQPGSGTQTDKQPVIGESGEIDFVTKNNKNYVKVEFEDPTAYEGAASGRKEYYILKASSDEITSGDYTKGIKAPQVTGAKHDDRSFHYEFLGWEMVEGSTVPATRASLPAAAPLPTLALFATISNATSPAETRSANTGGSSTTNLYTKEQIAKMAFTQNTKFRAVLRRVDNVLKPGTNEKIPDNYVPHLFLPGFGRRWTDGTSNPKVYYFDPESSNYYNDINNKVDDLGSQLKGFGGWSIYGAAGNELTSASPDYNKKETRVYVAKQARVDDVNASDIVLSVGDGIPGPDELVHGNDAKSNPNIVGVQGAGVYDINKAITKPGITTVVVNVTRTNDKKEQVIVPVKVHIRVLPKVIADKDLPEKGTKEYEFIAQNYTKVMYAAGEGGTMQSPMHTYWVRNGKESAIKDYIPDVLADKGYVFKDWSSKTIEKPASPADQRKATNEEREVLANIAIVDGMQFVAKIIRNSHNSTLAALQNLLSEAQKENAKVIYDAKKEQLAKIAESNGKNYLADLIRKSNNSTLAVLSNLLAQNITNPLEINNTIERDKLADLADAAGKSFVAKIIRSSKKSSLEALKQLLRNVGVNPETSLPEPKPIRETIITANFEKMAPMKFKFSGSAREGILTNFSLQNMTEGNLNADGTPDTKNTKITVDGKEVTINDLVSQVKNSVNGINANCAGTACTISGTPKIVDGKPKVELTFTTTDKYGREAEITVEIDVISESKPVPVPVPTPAPVPTPVPPAPTPAPSKPEEEPRQEEYPMPELYPYIPMPEAPSTEVVPEQAAEPKQKIEPEAVKDTAKQPSEALPQTGSDVTQSALVASLLASVGLAGFAAKHRRRKNEDNES
ncbi:InlB B-repeat-containing protein [Gardnerella sp. Marseille-Q9181]|uniref:InlB B-repeat-containing protein n=1 Tax=Gardnerella sp. Marseille-Q9181 TaxID=3383029 RepID=UPI003AF68D74